MLQKEQAKAEKESRKEKKREKKEKKKKEKEEKLRLNGEVEKKSHSRKDSMIINIRTCRKTEQKDYGKQKQYENEQLERSGLSEEHGPPSSVPTLCDSSDSTQNSGKRKKPSSPTESGRQNQSTKLRIRLPLARNKDSQEQPSKKQRTEIEIGPSISIKQSSLISTVKTNVQMQASSSAVRTYVQGHASSSAVRTNVQAQASGSATRVATAASPVASVKQCISLTGRTKGPAQDRCDPSTSTMPPSHILGRSDAVSKDRSESATGASLGPSSSMKQSIPISEPAPVVGELRIVFQ
ncbi:hypothetical protein ACHQM5_010828 [Ranunculus cassubicifolius]